MDMSNARETPTGLSYVSSARWRERLQSAPGRTLCLLAVDPRDVHDRVKWRTIHFIHESTISRGCLVIVPIVGSGM